MKNIFTLESQVYASLSHPKRLQILHLLSHEALTVTQIVEMTGLPQAAVSQHLMTLKKLHLVTATKNAQSRIYTLASPQITSLFTAVRSFLLTRFAETDLQTLDRYSIHIDPVCHMEVTVKGAAGSTKYENTRYYFCALGCKKRFDHNPHKYLAKHLEHMSQKNPKTDHTL